jgi:hypothetical protein
VSREIPEAVSVDTAWSLLGRLDRRPLELVSLSISVLYECEHEG